eukprot:3706413-Prymnesium_polylepis.1
MSGSGPGPGRLRRHRRSLVSPHLWGLRVAEAPEHVAAGCEGEWPDWNSTAWGAAARFPIAS